MTETKWRLDATRERFRLQRKQRTPEGFLDIWGVVATAYYPLEYTEADGGERVEIPLPETLRGSLESLRGAIVTFEHPEVGLLDVKTVKPYNVGHVIDAHFEEATGEQRVRLRITDEYAIEEIESGSVPDLSPGYRVEEAREATEEEREKYNADMVQLTRYINHVALTAAGRGDAPLRLDSRHKGEADMAKKTEMNPDAEPDKKDAEGEESYADMVAENEELKEKLDEMEAERADMMKKLDATMKKLDAMQAKMDMAEGEEAKMDMIPPKKEDADEENMDEDEPKMNMDSKKLGAWFVEHKRALELADVLGLDVSVDEPTVNIKRRVIAHNLRNSDVRVDSKSNTYIEVAFDQLYERAVVNPNSPQALAHAVRSERLDSAGDLLSGIKVTSRREQFAAATRSTEK